LTSVGRSTVNATWRRAPAPSELSQLRLAMLGSLPPRTGSPFGGRRKAKGGGLVRAASAALADFGFGREKRGEQVFGLGEARAALLELVLESG